MHANERRLQSYMDAARNWPAARPGLTRVTADLPLLQAHALIAERAEGLLPCAQP